MAGMPREYINLKEIFSDGASERSGPLGSSWVVLEPLGASWGLLEPLGSSWGFSTQAASQASLAAALAASQAALAASQAALYVNTWTST